MTLPPADPITPASPRSITFLLLFLGHFAGRSKCNTVNEDEPVSLLYVPFLRGYSEPDNEQRTEFHVCRTLFVCKRTKSI